MQPKQLYSIVHELDSRLYNNLYVNGVQTASPCCMGQLCSKFGEILVLSVIGPVADGVNGCATVRDSRGYDDHQPRHSSCVDSDLPLAYSAS